MTSAFKYAQEALAIANKTDATQVKPGSLRKFFFPSMIIGTIQTALIFYYRQVHGN
jgi:hypothetical protein